MSYISQADALNFLLNLQIWAWYARRSGARDGYGGYLYGGAQEDIPGFEPGGKAIDAAFLALGRYKGKGSGVLGVNSQGEVVLGGGEGRVLVHVI